MVYHVCMYVCMYAFRTYVCTHALILSVCTPCEVYLLHVYICMCMYVYSSRSNLASPPTGSSPLSLSPSSLSALSGDVTLMLLAVVAFAADELQQQDRTNTLHILKNICVKGVYVYTHREYIHILHNITYMHIYCSRLIFTQYIHAYMYSIRTHAQILICIQNYINTYIHT